MKVNSGVKSEFYVGQQQSKACNVWEQTFFQHEYQPGIKKEK